MAAAESEDGAEVEGVAQGVGDHDGLGLAGGVGGFELLGADVSGDGVVVEEDGDGAGLDDGGDGGGETGGDGDDFVAGEDALVRRQLMGGEGGEGDEVGGGAGVDEEAVFHAEEGGEFLLEGFAFGAEGEPEVEGGADGGFDFGGVKYAAGIGDSLTGGPGRVGGVVTGALAGVEDRGVVAGNYPSPSLHNLTVFSRGEARKAAADKFGGGDGGGLIEPDHAGSAQGAVGEVLGFDENNVRGNKIGIHFGAHKSDDVVVGPVALA